MKLFARKSLVSILGVSALAGILVLLAFLQFDWVNKVAQAEQERMEAALNTAIIRFRWDFYTQLLHVCSAFQVEPKGLSRNTLQAYADRYEDWMHASTRPRLVAALFVWKAQGRAGRRLFRLNPATGKFEGTAWPPEFEGLPGHLRHDPARFFHRMGRSDSPRHWNLVEQVPALALALWTAGPSAQSRAAAALPEGYVIIELNMKYMQAALFPLLIERYFHGPRGFVYRVSITSLDHPGEAIYRSAPGMGSNSGYPPDAVVDLIPVHHVDILESPVPGGFDEAQDLKQGKNLLTLSAGRQEGKGLAPLVFLAGQRADWQVIVRHPSGSVHAAVVELRRQDLAVSLGVLVVLALSIGLVIVSAQRAQRLARVQMDFVAGISHELRTPLAVICSAAENLADGVLGGGQQVKNYGTLIKNEGRRLTEMVEQTLGFAAEQAARQPGDRLPVEIASVVDRALDQAGSMIESCGVRVEKRIEPGLPPVMAHAPALTRCLQNLVINAVKYGGESRWVRISARALRGKTGRKRLEVEIVVEDKGIGIEAGDLPHIFEPFYRGRSREVAQIHGTGLGLSLAKDIAEAMGGILSVRSEPAKGSSFALRLPALAATESPMTAEAVTHGLEGFEAAKK